MENIVQNPKNSQKRKGNFSNAKRKKDMMSIQNGSNKAYKENLQAGDFLNVKISALGAKNIGVAELKNGYTLLVPNTKCGEKVQIKVEKTFLGKNMDSVTNQKIKYAVATVIEGEGEKAFRSVEKSNSLKFDFQVGQKFKVTISKKGPKNSGLVPISKNFLLIVPNTKVGDKVSVEIQKIKQNYAFAKAILSSPERENAFGTNDGTNEKIGEQYHLVIPTSAKSFSNYFVFKLNGKLLFVKKTLGVQFNDLVKIQIQRATSKFEVAKILKIHPMSVQEQKQLMRQNFQKMIQSSMHFGEKAIRCNANMRKYIWYRKKGSNVSSSLAKRQRKALIQKPLVKRGRHIFNLFKTQRCFQQALKQLAKYAAKGKTFLFVGTKKPAASLVAKTALLSHTSFFVNTRWLGGMLTNWKTIFKSISQIRPILKQKQKIFRKILEKRQTIQRRLFQKVYLLRKKSQKLMLKGKYFIRQILNSKNFLIERSQKLMKQKNAILQSNLILLNASKNFKQKKSQVLKQIQQLENRAGAILKQKQEIKSLLSTNIAKFQELEQIFAIGQEFLRLKNSIEKNGQKKFIAIPYEKLATLPNSENTMEFGYNIPNPSPEIFQKILYVLSTFRQEDAKQKIAFQKTEEQFNKFSNRSKSADTETQSTKTILLSKFFNKFLAFLPFFKKAMETLSLSLIQQQKMLQALDSTLHQIADSQKVLKELYQKMVAQLSNIFSKFVQQKNNFQKFELLFKQFASEQRLLKFLPKLRYLPTSQAKMYQTVELFMKKFVDPKLTYPMEQIYDQNFKFTSKKIAATRKQKWQRLEKYFGGIKKMAKMNTKQISKNVAIIVGQQEEMNAVRECRKLGMKIFAVVDTNCNPKFVDHIIPANDDSRNSIKYILGEMLTYIRLGQKLRQKVSVRSKLQTSARRRRFENETRSTL